MDSSSAIVLDDTDILSELCGVNDGNLKVIESLVGNRVFCRGNELFLESSDPGTHALFRELVARLLHDLSEGRPISPDLITAAHASVNPQSSPEERQEFREAFIQIPSGFGRIFPRSINQAKYISGMASYDIVFSIGPAGTGKTYLAVAYALKEILSKQRRKLILTRPVVEAGESLGFLPGDLIQKINPYLRPLYDAMEALIPYETLRRLEENRVIEIAPLAYMRGRSLNGCIVILDEGQNTTKEQMKMFLTRIGEGSKAIVTGDITQIDLPRKTGSGLVHALSVLEGIEEISFNMLDAQDVVRHPLIKKIIRAYEADSR